MNPDFGSARGPQGADSATSPDSPHWPDRTDPVLAPTAAPWQQGHPQTAPYQSSFRREPAFGQPPAAPQSIAANGRGSNPAHPAGPGGFLPEPTFAAPQGNGAPLRQTRPQQPNRYHGEGFQPLSEPTPVYPSVGYGQSAPYPVAGQPTLSAAAYAPYPGAPAASSMAGGPNAMGYSAPLGYSMTPPAGSTFPPRRNWALLAASALLFGAGLAGGLLAFDRLLGDSFGTDSASIPTLYPPAGDERALPVNSGGLVIPDRDKLLLNDGRLDQGPEIIRPAPERPLELEALPIALGESRQPRTPAALGQLQDPFADLLQGEAAAGRLPEPARPAADRAAVASPFAPTANSPLPDNALPSLATPVAPAGDASPDIGEFLRELDNDSSSLRLPGRGLTDPRRSLQLAQQGAFIPAPSAEPLLPNAFQAERDFVTERRLIALDKAPADAAVEDPLLALSFRQEPQFVGESRSDALARSAEGAEEQTDNAFASLATNLNDTTPESTSAFRPAAVGWQQALAQVVPAPAPFAQELDRELAVLLPGRNQRPAPFTDSNFDPFNALASLALPERNLIPSTGEPLLVAPETGDGSQFAQLSIGGGGAQPLSGGGAPLPALVDEVEADIRRFNQMSSEQPLMLQPDRQTANRQQIANQQALAAARAQAASNSAPVDGPFGDAAIAHRPTPPALPSAQVIAPFGIQLGALTSQDEAQSFWARLQRQHVELLGDMLLDVQTVTVKGRQYYRVQAGPIPNRATASDLCALLKAEKQDCIVVER